MSTARTRRPLLRGRSFSIPAYLVAILALVLSMGGAAVAGGMVTGKQIKNGTVTSADIKNNSVKSTDIKNGSLHLKDIHPASRPFACLPSGITIVGGGIMAGVGPSDAYLRYYSPLPFTACDSLTGNMFFGSPSTISSGQANTERCSGSSDNPTAAPGTLCIYVSDTVVGVTAGQTFLFAGPSANSDGAESSGFYVGSNVEAGGDVRLQYVWAYTAA